MADIRITDLVDPKAIEDLREVQSEVRNVMTVFNEAVRTLSVKAIQVKVETIGDVDNINKVVVSTMQKAQEATSRLNVAMDEQKKIVEQTTNTISRELSEIEKENRMKREAFNQDKSVLDMAKSVIGTRDQNIERLIKEQARMKSLKDEQKRLSEEVKKGNITQEEAYKKRVEIEGQYRQTKATVQELTRVLNNQDKELNAAEGSYRQLSLQLEQVKMAYKQLNDEEKNSPMGEAMLAEIDKMDAHLKDLSADMGEFQRNVGNYAIAAGDYVDVMLKAVGVNGKFGSSLKMLAGAGGGDILDGLSTKLKAFGATLKGFITNPAILAILGIGGTIAAFKWWYDYNKGIMEATRLTREFLGVVGDDLVEVRSEIQAISDEWGKDYKEVLETVDVLMKQYSIDSREALDVVRGGFQAGADYSGNMLNNMKNYAPIFKDMKLEGSKLAAVLAQTRSGIFNEQGLQMMQMATKRLREMSTSTQKSLEAIGVSTEEWQKKLESGESNFFEYLQHISKKLGELPQESNEVGNVLKDVFGRNGAAGGMELVKYFGEMTTNLEEVKKVTGEVGTLHDQHIEKVKELNTKVAALFDVTQDGFEEATLAGKNYLTEVLIKVVDYLQKVVDWTIAWYDESVAFRAVVETVGLAFNTLWQNFKTGAKNSFTLLEGLAKATRALFSLDFKEFGKAVTDTFMEYAKNVKNMLSGVESAYEKAENRAKYGRKAIGASVGSLMKKEEKNEDQQEKNGGGEGGGTTHIITTSKEKAAKEMEDAHDIIIEATRKIIVDRLKLVEEGSEEEMELTIQLAEAEMAVAISTARKNFEKQKKDLDTALSQKTISQEEYNKGMEVLNEELIAAELAAEHEKNESISDARKKYADAEIERISEYYAVQATLRDTAYVEEVTELEQQYAEGIIRKEEYERALYETKVKYEQASAIAVIESLQKQLDAEVLTAEARESVIRELAKAQAELAKKEADAEISEMERVMKAEDDLAKKRQQNMRKWMQTASQAIGKIKGLMDAMYDIQLQKIEEENEENRSHYDEEVERIESLAERGAISTEEAEARKTAAEKRHAEKEQELEKKKQEIEYKKAVWEKATSIAQAGIATALAITQALPNIALAAVVGAMGAIQVATILATPIKAYAKGTGEKGHDGGLAMVGDGGKREVVVIGNTAWLTPDKPVVVDLPKGAMVYPDVDEWNMEVPQAGAMSLTDKEPRTLVVNDYKRLEKKMDERNRLARMEMRLMLERAYREEFDRYRKSR